MLGAIIGDICGSTYEFHNVKSKDIDLFPEGSTFTDDTVMTIAVSTALMYSFNDEIIDKDIFRINVTDAMRNYGKDNFLKGYGNKFRRWLLQPIPFPYGSCGNGSAMRVSSVGWVADSLEETCKIAKVSAAVTHNHPEGIKGAQAIASAIFLLRTGRTKEQVKTYIQSFYHYDLSRSVDEIRKTNKFYVTCQKSVPEAIICFLEGNDFEDVIRNAISIGGDSDTIAAIAGSLAETIYTIPQEMMDKSKEILSKTFDEEDFKFYNYIIRPRKLASNLTDDYSYFLEK